MTQVRYDVLISAGSNIEPETSIPRATRLLRDRFRSVRVSPAYSGPALDEEGGLAPDRPPFVNLAVRLGTDLPYRALREVCLLIEEICGRVRTADRYAPRTLDLDPVFGDPAFVASSAGALPARDLGRPYVLVPAADVWPEAVASDAPGTFAERAAALPASARGMLDVRVFG